MPGEEETDTSRKTVKTFVPAYQKDEWKRHADELDMSQSEFVRTMVQAGRRGFEIETPDAAQSGPVAGGAGASGIESNGTGAPDSAGSAGSNIGAGAGDNGGGVSAANGGGGGGNVAGGGNGLGGADLEAQILSVLSASEHLSWERLVEELTDDIEDRLDETVQRLQAENRVRYSGRHGGYALLAGDDGN